MLRFSIPILGLLFLLSFSLPADALTLSRNLGLGMSGADVSSLQEFLKGSGDFTHPRITGYYGPVTAEAVRKFQARNGIVSSGTPESTGYGAVGPKTRALILRGAATAGAAGGTGPVMNPTSPPVQTSTPYVIEPPVIMGNLSFGVSSSDVKKLQLYLLQTGDYTGSDAVGFFGVATEKAVQKYQARKGIVSSGTPETTGYGTVGPATRAVLASDSGPVSSSPAGTGTGGVSLSITAVPNSVPRGSPATLAWSSSAASCNITGPGLSMTAGSSGSVSTGVLYATSLYILTCTFPSGDRAQRSTTVSVEGQQAAVNTQQTTLPSSVPGSATAVLYASPSQVLSGESTLLSWYTTNASSCTASGSWAGSKAPEGSELISNVTSVLQFLLSCAGPAGGANASASVSLLNPQNPTAPAPPAYTQGTYTSGTAYTQGSYAPATAYSQGSYVPAYTQGSYVTYAQGTYAPSGQVQNPATVIDGFSIPWELAFLPGGDMLVTERDGTFFRISGTTKNAVNISGVVNQGEGGLLGLAIHPQFSQNSYIYLYMTSQGGSGLINRVERYTLAGTALSDRRVIIDNIPGANYHDGGRIKFGPDGMLYIGTGDAGDKPSSQNTGSLAGKILRLRDDGTIPSDNPFGNAVWSYGHRNVQGLAFDASGQLWATEHGPSGDEQGVAKDELNKIVRGGNYGWAIITGDETRSGMITPQLNAGPLGENTWAPSGIAYLNGYVVWTGLRGQSLYVANISSGTAQNLQKYFTNQFGRLRSVVVGPDGMLYILTNNQSTDKIIRIDPRSVGIGSGSGSTPTYAQGTYAPATSAAPTITFTATPTSVTSGGSVTLTWSATNASSCTASGASNWTGTRAQSGSSTFGNLTANTTFNLSCQGDGGTTQKSVTVTVSAPAYTQGSYAPAYTQGSYGSGGGPSAPSSPAAVAQFSYTCTTNYYVSKSGNNANSGTSPGSAWNTISQAVNVLNNGQARGGTCVNVDNGAYTETVHAGGLRGSQDSANGYVVFRAINKQQAAVHSFALGGGTYIVIDGFDIDGHLGGGGSNEDGVTTGDGSHHIRILNSRIHDHGGSGVGAVHTDYLFIEGNTIYGNANTSPYHKSGISTWQAVASDNAPGFHNVIRNNIVYGNAEINTGSTHTDGNGIIIDDLRNTQLGSSYPVYTPQTLVENNLVYDNGGAGIHAFLSDNVTIRNNTVVNNSLDTANPSTWRGGISLHQVSNALVVNNIAVGNPSVNGNNTAYVDGGANAGIVWKNNLSFNGTAGQASVGGSNTNALTAGNGNLLGVNPLFVNAAAKDFRLQSGSPAIGAGTTAYGLPNDDLAGKGRSGAPDLGAYDF